MKKTVNKNWNFSTKAIHAGNEADEKTGAVAPPIHLTSTYLQDAVGQDRGYDYSRVVNPTRNRLEVNLAALENCKYGVSFATGMAATTALFQLFNAGDHLIISRNTYGGTYRMAMNVLQRQGLEFQWVDSRNPQNIEAAINKNTKMVMVETPTNPMLGLCDIQATAEVCQKHGILLAVDNTFMSPYGQRPLDFGAHVSLHSSTKYLGGHSDVLGGVLLTNDSRIAEQLHFIQKSTGAVPSPFDCWLILRSTKTLELRYQKAADNALELAQWLNERDELTQVIYPGLDNHPQYQLAVKQQRTPKGEPIFGSIISIDLGSLAVRDQFLKRLKLFTLAESLGGVESLICNPYHMTHAAIPVKDKLAMGITESLVRLSVGIETIDDLKEDLHQALKM
ncbi:MAG: trans-sulfuration enzyme family protein [Fidelibacterota bacterium]